MNYFSIGQRIRKYRKAINLTQEQLAEKIGISVVHMSHIETGNTKMSLSVFADIAEALDISADKLLYDTAPPKEELFRELSELIAQCTPQQLEIITDIAKATKQSLDRNY